MGWFSKQFAGNGDAGRNKAPQVTVNIPNQEKQEQPKPTGLASHAGMFKSAETDYKAPDFDPTKLFDKDPKKIQEAISQINFVNGVTAEQKAAIEAGGEGAVAAMMQLVNQVGQQAINVSMQANAGMVESAIAAAAKHVDTRFEHKTREQRIEQAIIKSNPAFANEGGKPMVDFFKGTILAKYPNATDAEIKDQITSYLKDFNDAGVPAEEDTGPKTNGGADDNWSDWMPDIEQRHE